MNWDSHAVKCMNFLPRHDIIFICLCCVVGLSNGRLSWGADASAIITHANAPLGLTLEDVK